MSRIFKVQVNIDDMCAELDTIRQDQYGEWLMGFRAGCRGRVPDGIDGPMLRGAEFGLSCHKSAADFHASQAERGRKSVESRKASYGTAQPNAARTPLERGSNTVQAPLEPLHTEPKSEPSAELSSIQYPVESNQQPETIERVAKAPRARFVPPSVDEVRDYCQERGNAVDPERFVTYYESVGWMIGKRKIVSWKACVRTWEAKDKERKLECATVEKFPSSERVKWCLGLTDIEPDDDWNGGR